LNNNFFISLSWPSLPGTVAGDGDVTDQNAGDCQLQRY